MSDELPLVTVPPGPPLTQEERRWILAYRETYGTSAGMAVLIRELDELRFFATDLGEDPEDLINMKKARQLLQRLGVWRPENISRIVRAIYNLPWENRVRPKGEDEDGAGSND